MFTDLNALAIGKHDFDLEVTSLKDHVSMEKAQNYKACGCVVRSCRRQSKEANVPYPQTRPPFPTSCLYRLDILCVYEVRKSLEWWNKIFDVYVVVSSWLYRGSHPVCQYNKGSFILIT